MKKILYSFIVLLSIGWLVACDNVNSMHDKYLVNGEDLLVGKLDTIKFYGGDQRAKILVWAGDYRATKFVILRADTSLTYKYDLSSTNRKDSMVFYMNGLKEGTNVLQLYAWNADSTVHSIVMNKTVTVWGNKYRKFLVNRVVASNTFNVLTKVFTINWNTNNVVEPILGKYAIGHEIKYTDTDGVENFIRDVYTSQSAPTLKTTLAKFPATAGTYYYRMMYLPATTCIDTFRTTYVSVTMP
ncbi:MAG: DUF4998 domain-containing protein [Bacteroidia bacterium]|nr:DUF4998 domain-containing protein [Bacteroidia bacterium]